MTGRVRLTGGGMRARWRGREYRIKAGRGIGAAQRYFLTRLDPDGPAPDGAAFEPEIRGEGRLVDPATLDAWYSTRWVFTWRGRDFVALSRTEAEVEGQLRGVDDAWARANGLTVLEPGLAQGGFPLAEVEDLHEERRDLLAEWTARRA